MLIAAIAAGWVAMGAVGVAVMRHRGHDTYAWAVLFLLLGPLAIPVAISSDRHRPVEPPRPLPPGGLDVLVAHDGSADATAALGAVLSLLGDRMTSLTLAAVVDLEAPTTVRGQETQREAQERLEGVAREVQVTTTAPVGTIILFGDPAHALQHFAVDQGYELIVAGSRTAGRSHLGSHRVARAMASRRSVPVLIGPTTP